MMKIVSFLATMNFFILLKCRLVLTFVGFCEKITLYKKC